MDSVSESPIRSRCSQNCMHDLCTGVLDGVSSSQETQGLEEIVFEEGGGDVVSYAEVQQLPCDGEADETAEQYMSPTQTIQTSETVVGSNQHSIVITLEEPRVGMVFKKWEDMEEYYKDYAEEQGFGVSRVQAVFSKGEVRVRTAITWRCECWGRPDMRAIKEARKRAKEMGVSGSGGVVGGKVCEDELNRRKRKSKKCECTAMLYGSINRDKEWEVRKVVVEHKNHTPLPSQSKLVKEYRMKHFSSRARRNLLNLYEEGVPVSQIYGSMAAERNGFDNVPFTIKDLQHEIYKARRLKMIRGDSAAMMSYFQHMQSTTYNFYHVQRVDGKGRLKDVFWVDGRSRVAYEEFGDVVCFDATYLTNAYALPFVNFVGVNHHGQSLLLGCALVSHEDCNTFSWVFTQWLSSMNNRAPAAILINQASAMRKPLEEVMPNTRHRWCIWHIMRKIPEKLGKCKRYKEFKSVLKKVVYESFSILEFENRWSSFVDEYDLKNNAWLKELYAERHMWIPAFMRDFFWAGMKTTQRVESINSFFDGFVHRKTKLFEFSLKYSKALEKRARDEADADANCTKYLRRLVSGFEVEKLFQKLYTDTKFQEIQTECTRMMYCFCVEERVVGDNLIIYLLEDRVWVVPEGMSEETLTDRRRFYTATFDTTTKEVLCDCRKFQTDGIMCKHMIRILDQNHVTDIPQKYILNRWRKDIVRKHTRVKVEYHDPSETVEVKRYNRLMCAFESLCDNAVMVSDESVDTLINKINELRDVVVGQKRRTQQEPLEELHAQHTGCTTSIPTNAGNADPSTGTVGGAPQSDSHFNVAEQEDFIPSNPPTTKRPRGRPKGSRNKTAAERGYPKPQKRKSKGQNQQPTSTPVIAKLPVFRNHAGTHSECQNTDAETDLQMMDGLSEDDFLSRNTLSWVEDMSDSF